MVVIYEEDLRAKYKNSSVSEIYGGTIFNNKEGKPVIIELYVDTYLGITPTEKKNETK